MGKLEPGSPLAPRVGGPGGGCEREANSNGKESVVYSFLASKLETANPVPLYLPQVPVGRKSLHQPWWGQMG